MKIKINPYIQSLIRQYILYIVTSIILVFLTIFIYAFNITKFEDNKAKIALLESDVKKYEEKSKILNAPIIQEHYDSVEDYIKILQSLVPNSEDFFSIIYSLETISEKTGFVIQSYDVNVKQSSKEKITLSVLGAGNQDYFLNFLHNYNFAGGRYITMSNIEMTPDFSGSMKLDLNFYNKSVNTKNDKLVLNPEVFEKLGEIREKITFQLQDISVDEKQTATSDYAKKTDPFSWATNSQNLTEVSSSATQITPEQNPISSPSATLIPSMKITSTPLSTTSATITPTQ